MFESVFWKDLLLRPLSSSSYLQNLSFLNLFARVEMLERMMKVTPIDLYTICLFFVFLLCVPHLSIQHAKSRIIWNIFGTCPRRIRILVKVFQFNLLLLILCPKLFSFFLLPNFRFPDCKLKFTRESKINFVYLNFSLISKFSISTLSNNREQRRWKLSLLQVSSKSFENLLIECQADSLLIITN
jgi:hypothetical protein